VVAHGMGDPGYDGVPFCDARKRENSRARIAGAFAKNFRPIAGQKWRVPTLVAASVASTSLKTVGGLGDRAQGGVGKVGSGGSVRLCRLHRIC